MNSEQSKLCINRSNHIDTRLLWETTVCCGSTQEVDNEIIKGSMS